MTNAEIFMKKKKNEAKRLTVFETAKQDSFFFFFDLILVYNLILVKMLWT